MSKCRKTTLVGPIFCNSISKGEAAKVDCKGVFTSFLAWSYPTSGRIWQALLTAYDLPPGTTTIKASISRGRGKKETLASVDIHRSEPDVGNVFNMVLGYKFPAEGFYAIHFNVIGTTESLKVPLLVTTQPWPRITKHERDFLRTHPAVMHSLRVNVQCSDCSRAYVFEENVLPDEQLAQGVTPFPESGELKCGTSCSHTLHLKDIQGQLLSSIKTAVRAAMRGGK